MKYIEMTKEEVQQRIRSGPRFTTEEMSVQDAIDLFKPDEKGDIYKSYVLLESVVPEEYMDSKEFFMGIIPTRYPVSFASVLSYASTRLKNDKELVSYAIEHHAYSAIYALKESVGVKNSELLRKYKKDENVYIAPVHNIAGELVRYEVKSNLLKDKEYLTKEIGKNVNNKSFSSIVESVIENSEVCASDKEFVLNALESVENATNSLYYIDKSLFEDKDVLLKCIEKIFESKNYSYFKKLELENEKAENESFSVLFKLCNKLEELPADSKIRKHIYAKIAKRYLEKIKTNEIENTL